MQDFLTILIELIAVSSSLYFGFNFLVGIPSFLTAARDTYPATTQQSEASATDQHISNSPLTTTQVPDPWTLAAPEPIVPTSASRSLPQLQLLLPPRKTDTAIATPAANKLHELLPDLQIDKLQLRPARKIARTLGINQKVNGKDQPLTWLRTQIKLKLQHSEALPTSTIDGLHQLLVS